jgi:precorrin-2 dehydrogenase/sirohydrochlorin ferrochelatase
MRYYPVFLNLKGKKAVVVGGGKVAERKAIALVKSGALVEIISPTITKSLERYTKKGLIKHIKRNYKKGDLKGAFVVVIGTSSQEANIKIAKDAELRKGSQQLINVVDTPSQGNFIVPSVVRRGPLTIAISTEGCSPAVSKAIRKEIERRYDSSFAHYLQFVRSIRKKAMEKIRDNKKREKFLKALASEEIFNTLKSKGLNAVSKKILNHLDRI